MISGNKSFSYDITTDPKYMDDKFSITPELSRQMEGLYYKVLRGTSTIIERLIKLIERYPKVPQLKNYLSVAYMKSGDIEKAREVNHWIISEHPDYLFGKLNLCFEYYEKKQYHKIPEVVGSLMEIQDLYPDRNCFHLTEVTSFNKLAIMYFCALGNLEAAESRYEILEKLAPDHPDTKDVLPHIMSARLEAAKTRMEEEDRTRIRVKTNNPDPTIQRDIKPEFKNSEINWLYENGLRIEKEKLKAILRLPYESLVSDLNMVLKDTIFRYQYFRKITANGDKWQEARMNFPIHAIYLLGELRAKESLGNILETFRQGEEFLDFWYGDFLTGNLWEPLYYLGGDQLDILKDFVLTPNMYTYARSEVASAVGQTGLHQPKRSKEVIKWFRGVFNHLAEASPEDGLTDSDFIGLAICNVLDLRAKELLPEIKRLFDLGYVSKGICGDYHSVEKEFREPANDWFKKKLLDIYGRYHEITTTWYGYTGKDRIINKEEEPLKIGKKPGRNDPCPCGSGKKYKKCCLTDETGAEEE